METIILAAVAPNGGMGKDGELPWNIPGDLRRFREITDGHWLLMGRKTYESVPFEMDNRKVVVMTSGNAMSLPQKKRRPGAVKRETVVTATNIEEVLEQLKRDGCGKVFVCGGVDIYREVIDKNLATKAIFTVFGVLADYDRQFPYFHAEEFLHDNWSRGLYAITGRLGGVEYTTEHYHYYTDEEISRASGK